MPMSALPALAALKDEIHLSQRQIRTYLGCSLKYRLQYVEGLPMERVGISLIFGAAIHSALERYYRQLAFTETEVPLEELQEFFAENLSTRLEAEEAEVIYNKKDLTDKEASVALGHAMLAAFHDGAKERLGGHKILGVELPLGTELYDENGFETGLLIIGVIDLLLQDQQGNVIAIDHKTASRAYQQADVESDLQLSAYAYLLRDNLYAKVDQDIECGFDVLRKLKKPKVEPHRTRRTTEDIQRFHKTALAVARGIESKAFMPNRSWACAECSHRDACKDW